jgi:hypothetical protein
MLVVVYEFYVAKDEESMQKTPPGVRDLYAITPALSVDRQDLTVCSIILTKGFKAFRQKFPSISKGISLHVHRHWLKIQSGIQVALVL